MISDRLQCLAQLLHSFVQDGRPMEAANVHLVAHALEAMLPAVQAMEDRPVPVRFRLVQGGKQ